MVETKYNTSHHAGGTPEARIANRLRPSHEERPDHVTQKGSGPNRTITAIHHAGHPINPGTAARESGPQEQHRHDIATTQSVGGNPKGGQ
jgi:hypothetical protein